MKIMDSKSKNEVLPITNYKKGFINTYLEDMNGVVLFLHNNRYMDAVEQKMEKAEKEGKENMIF